jgi:glycerol transport system ATP-binding protein
VQFDGVDVTQQSPQQRNIAQVFQFPVIYDTMTVAQNLAFPLRNRKLQEDQIKQRVGKIAEMLELSAQLDQRAANLSADAKQKISLGRGLVRSDVSAVLFDEPLTVIDPHLKWQLRKKLKQIHHELKLTLIYVTHDQVEALTFAEEVVVMTQGRAVQIGSASALFERPAHTFVGHFIGSPGMNFLPVRASNGALQIAGRSLPMPATMSANTSAQLRAAGVFKLGVRPEYLTISDASDPHALPAQVQRWQDVGTHQILTAHSLGEAEAVVLRARVGPQVQALHAGDTVWLRVLGEHTCFYQNEVLVA